MGNTEEFSKLLTDLISELTKDDTFKRAKKMMDLEKSVKSKIDEIYEMVNENESDFTLCNGGLVIGFNIDDREIATCIIGSSHGVNNCMNQLNKRVDELNKGNK